MERVVVRKTFELPGDFYPSVAVGENIRPGVEIGIGRIPTVLAQYELGAGIPLVDDGTFVTAHAPLLEYRRGFSKEIIGSTNEGIVRLRTNVLEIVSEEKEEPVISSVWGKVLAIGEQEYTVEVKHLKLPIFVGAGDFVDTEVHLLFDKGMVVGPHHIEASVKDKVVILPAALTYDTYLALVANKAAGVLAPSIDWEQYLEVFRNLSIGVGILHGFGMFPLWKWYMQLFSKLQNVTIEVDFQASCMYIPISDILLGSLSQEMLLFKEYWWGKQVRELAHESGEYIAVLETGEKTPVASDELFNMR